MNVVYRDIQDDVEYFDGNPTKHDVAELKASIKAYGFKRVMLFSDGEIVAGNGCTEALRELYAEAPNHVPADIMVFISLDQFQKYPQGEIVLPDGFEIVVTPPVDAEPTDLIGVKCRTRDITEFTITGQWYAPYSDVYFKSDALKSAFVIEENLTTMGGSGMTFGQKMTIYDGEKVQQQFQAMSDAGLSMVTTADTQSVFNQFLGSSANTTTKPQEKITYENQYGDGAGGNTPRTGRPSASSSKSNGIRKQTKRDQPDDQYNPHTPDVVDFNDHTEQDAVTKVNMNFIVSTEQQQTILDALTISKTVYKLASNDEAIAKIAAHFVADCDQIRAQVQL